MNNPSSRKIKPKVQNIVRSVSNSVTACGKSKKDKKNMSFVVLNNDGQYTYDSTNVIGVCATLNTALLFGWKSLLEEALKPWTIEFYKDRDEEFANCCGISYYYIEEWDTTNNIRSNVYHLGWKCEGSHIKQYLDKHLKKNSKECKTILEKWHNEVHVYGKVPQQLQDEYTFKKEES